MPSAATPPNTVPTQGQVTAPGATTNNGGGMVSLREAIGNLTTAINNLLQHYTNSSRGASGMGGAAAAAATATGGAANTTANNQTPNLNTLQTMMLNMAYGPWGAPAAVQSAVANNPTLAGTAGSVSWGGLKAAATNIGGGVMSMAGGAAAMVANVSFRNLPQTTANIGNYFGSELGNRAIANQAGQSALWDAALSGKASAFAALNQQSAIKNIGPGERNVSVGEKVAHEVQSQGNAGLVGDAGRGVLGGIVGTAKTVIGAAALAVPVVGPVVGGGLMASGTTELGGAVSSVANLATQGNVYGTHDLQAKHGAAADNQLQAGIAAYSSVAVEKGETMLSQYNAVRRMGARRLQGQHLTAFGQGAAAGMDMNESITGATELASRFGAEDVMRGGIFKSASQLFAKRGVDVQAGGSVLGALMQGHGDTKSDRANKEFEKVISTGIKAGMKDPQSWELAGNILAKTITTSTYGASGAEAVNSLFNVSRPGQRLNMFDLQTGASGLGKFNELQDSNPYFRAINLERAKGILGENASWEAVSSLGGASVENLIEHSTTGKNPYLKGAGFSKEQAKQQVEGRIEHALNAALGGDKTMLDVLAGSGKKSFVELAKDPQAMSKKVKGWGGEQTTVEELLQSTLTASGGQFGLGTSFKETGSLIRVLTGKEGTGKDTQAGLGDHAHTQLGLLNGTLNKLETALNNFAKTGDWSKANQTALGKLDEKGKPVTEGVLGDLTKLKAGDLDNFQKVMSILIENINKVNNINITPDKVRAVEEAIKVSGGIKSGRNISPRTNPF